MICYTNCIYRNSKSGDDCEILINPPVCTFFQATKNRNKTKDGAQNFQTISEGKNKRWSKMRKIIFFLKIVWRKWEYGGDDPLSFRIDYKTAWKVAKTIYD